MDLFRLNRETAYKGEIGKEREAFCVQYMKLKQERLKESGAIQNRILESIILGASVEQCRKESDSCDYYLCGNRYEIT